MWEALALVMTLRHKFRSMWNTPLYSPLCKKLLSPPKETYAGVQKNGRRTSNIQFLMATSDTRQYFGHLMQKTDSLEKTLMLLKIEGGLLLFFFFLQIIKAS